MSEWGPWVEHDGKGCPCKGHYVHVIFWARKSGKELETEGFGIAARLGDECWNWANWPKYSRILRYRIRKPRGLTILEEILNDLPAPVGPKVDA